VFCGSLILLITFSSDFVLKIEVKKPLVPDFFEIFQNHRTLGFSVFFFFKFKEPTVWRLSKEQMVSGFRASLVLLGM